MNIVLWDLDPNISFSRTYAASKKYASRRGKRGMLISIHCDSPIAQHVKKLLLRLGHLIWPYALPKWIIAHAHLCSNGLGASLRSLPNGHSIQTCATLSCPEKDFFKTLEDGTRVKRKLVFTIHQHLNSHQFSVDPSLLRNRMWMLSIWNVYEIHILYCGCRWK